MDVIGKFINSLDIATESISDITTFIDNPDFYLEATNKKTSFEGEHRSYVEALQTGGRLYQSIITIGNELIRVNAYAEAIRLYSAMIDRFTIFSKDSDLTKDDVEEIKWSISELKTTLMNVLSLRDEYNSKRKSVIAKYSDLLNML